MADMTAGEAGLTPFRTVEAGGLKIGFVSPVAGLLGGFLAAGYVYFDRTRPELGIRDFPAIGWYRSETEARDAVRDWFRTERQREARATLPAGTRSGFWAPRTEERGS